VETYLEEVPQIVPPEPPRPIVQTRTIELDRFVRLKKIDAAYYHAPYFVVPRDAVGQEAFAVIRKAMAEKKLAQEWLTNGGWIRTNARDIGAIRVTCPHGLGRKEILTRAAPKLTDCSHRVQL